MNKKDSHIDIELLISKHLANQTSSEEDKLLLDAIQNDKQTEMLFKDMKEVYFLSSGATHHNTDPAFEKVLEKIESGITAEKSNAKTKKLPLKQLLYIAASVAFIFGLFNYLNKEQPMAEQLITLNVQTEKQQIELSDHSNITLQKDAELMYPKNFAHGTREVSFEGTGFFEIKRNTKAPFIIKTPDVSIEVLGTSFNVETHDTLTIVYVHSGKVKVTSLKDDAHEILEKNEFVYYTPSNKKLTKGFKESNNMLAWYTGILTFNNTPLKTVAKDISKYYGVKVKTKQSIEKCLLSTTFDHESLQSVFELLELTFNIQVTEENGSFTIDGDGCNF